MSERRNADRRHRSSERSVEWTGRSGRTYRLTAVPGGDALLAHGFVYAVWEGGLVRWIGTGSDIIEDHASRTRFRAVLTKGATMFRMPAPDDPVAVMTIVWDLDNTPHRHRLSAA